MPWQIRGCGYVKAKNLEITFLVSYVQPERKTFRLFSLGPRQNEANNEARSKHMHQHLYLIIVVSCSKCQSPPKQSRIAVVQRHLLQIELDFTSLKAFLESSQETFCVIICKSISNNKKVL